uniref:Serpin domain-containing protein n=1 Tax=Hordeum vulgare subsp. vulgare TaxID=112509 RepID=A0A8I7B9I5_HORVV
MTRGFIGSDALTALTHRLADQLSVTREPPSNLAFSPLSIYSALSLVAAGARGGTLDELLAVLGASSRDELAENGRFVAEHALADRSPSGGPRVGFASCVWHDAGRTLEPAYIEAVAASYLAEIRAVDFRNKADESREEINKWVAAATGNLIDSILPRESVGKSTAVVLANAIYFKGKWKKPFKKKSTKVERFYLVDGTAVDAPMMRTGRSQYIDVHHGFKVLRLPYRSKEPGASKKRRRGTSSGDDPAPPLPRYSMCVFLPDARDGLWDLVGKIASSPSFLRDRLPDEAVEVDKFRLPKFKVSFYGKLSGALRDLGLKAAFNVDKADLTDMAPDFVDRSGQLNRLVLKDVFHRAVVEVNEEGTEAAAVTVCDEDDEGADWESEPEPVDFIADHPFAFFVIEEMSGAVVFAGHVLDPTKHQDTLHDV